jgi:hypothetical protein
MFDVVVVAMLLLLLLLRCSGWNGEMVRLLGVVRC